MMNSFLNKPSLMAATFGLIFNLSTPAFAGDAHEYLQSEEAQVVLKQSFTHELKFSTDLGELTLSFTNNPDEKDMHYLRPLSLPKSANFVDFSHKKFLSGIGEYLNSLETEWTNLPAESLVENSSLEDSNAEYIEPAEDKKRMSDTDFVSEQPLQKYVKLLTDNAAYPLKFQNYNFATKHKFAFNQSVMTLNWSFESKEGPNDYADLNIFSEESLFYEYTKNSLVNFLKMKFTQDDEHNFNQMRASLYL